VLPSSDFSFTYVIKLSLFARRKCQVEQKSKQKLEKKRAMSAYF
jgi:hypothetical protein